MSILYNITIKIYSLLISVASLFNNKAKLWSTGRVNVFNNLINAVGPKNKIIWFHAASLGEFEQGRPVIERFRNAYPEFKILLTFFSPSGYEVRKNYNGADFIFYLPVDTKKNAQKFLSIVQPEIAVFIKYEFWYNYITELHKNNIPIFIISAIFREDQHFFKWYGAWFRNMLYKITFFFVQNSTSLNLLNSIGINHVEISGDTRFDRVYDIAQNRTAHLLIEYFTKNNKVLLAGSSWPAGEKMIKYISLKLQDLKIIIAPHEVHKEHINSIIQLFEPEDILCYSNANESNIAKAKILIIDQIGILSNLYQYCDVAYIGGGFGKGIHNILEAVTFGKPVLFGPNYKKFKEAVDLIKKEGAFPISTEKEFLNTLKPLLEDEIYFSKTSNICSDFIKENLGATSIISKKIFSYIK